MEVVKPFSLQLPTGRSVDVVVLQDEQGNLIVRGAHEVTPHPLAAGQVTPVKPGGAQ